MIDNVCNNERVLMMVMKALLQMMAVILMVTLMITTLLKRVKMTKVMMAMILDAIFDVCNIVKGDVDGGEDNSNLSLPVGLSGKVVNPFTAEVPPSG